MDKTDPTSPAPETSEQHMSRMLHEIRDLHHRHTQAATRAETHAEILGKLVEQMLAKPETARAPKRQKASWE